MALKKFEYLFFKNRQGHRYLWQTIPLKILLVGNKMQKSLYPAQNYHLKNIILYLTYMLYE